MRTPMGFLVLVGAVLTACGGGADREGGPDRPPAAESGPCAAAAPLDDVDLTDEHDLIHSSDRGGSFDLWVTRPDGANPVQLTDDAAFEGMPAWSPDGVHVAFACTEGEGEQTDLYVMDADGSGRRAVTETPDCEEAPQWSPDGARLYFSGGPCDGQRGIWVVGVDGSDRQEVLPVGNWPALSSDGTRLLYDVPKEGGSFLETTIWSAAADGSGATEIGPPGLPAAFESAWSPDGQWIAFISPTGDLASEDPPKWGEDVFVMRADGSEVRRLTHSPGNDHWPPAWSPDGRSLVYSADGAANEHAVLVRVDVASGESTTITAPDGRALFPDWRD